MLNLFEEFFSVVQTLEEQTIRYAVIGGFAMAFHDSVRATRDIDFLVLIEDVKEISTVLETLGYRPSGAPFTFQDTRLTLHRFVKFFGTRHAMLDFLCGTEERYRSIVTNAIPVDPGNGIVHIATKEDLIYLKSMRNSEQDKIDIQRLRDDDKA